MVPQPPPPARQQATCLFLTLTLGGGCPESALSGPHGVRVEVSCRVPTPYCRPRSAAVGQVEGRDLRVLCVVWEVKVGRLLYFPLHCAAILGGS